MNKISLNKGFISRIKNILFPFYKSEEIKKIFSILEANQPKNKKVAMFVGGCVRNYLNNELINDIDIATIFQPEEIKRKFSKTKVQVIDTGIEHGSVTLLLNKKKFEITSLRKDIKTDGRHAEVIFTDDWEKDSERRDFTINAIYLDRKGKIFDPQQGVKDLRNKVVKFIGDPSKRIQEDYLRIIRFIRFTLQYNQQYFEPSTIEAIKLNLYGINNLSKERVLDEIFKILRLNNFVKIEKNNELKVIFSIIFPELKNLDYLKRIDLIPNSELPKIDFKTILALLLIDGSNNHEYFCHKYKVSNLIRERLNILSQSLKKYETDKNFFKKNIKKNIYYLGKEIMKEISLLVFCKNARLRYEELKKIISNIENTKIPKFPYNGEYLIKKGFVEGKQIGRALKELEMKWIENDYNLPEKNIASIISKIKKSDILNF